MSKIKNISRTGWLVAGIIAALLLVPTTAVAVSTATMTIIKGGSASGEASVTAAHQLLSTTVNPKAYVNTGTAEITSGLNGYAIIASPPSGDALIVTTIHIDTFYDPAPETNQYLLFFIAPSTTCAGSIVDPYQTIVTPSSIGETDIPFTPGLAIPAGDALCAEATNNIEGYGSATGYTVPSGEVPAGPLHRVSALPRQQR